MNTDVLNTLQEIRGLLFVLVVMAGIRLVAWLVQAVTQTIQKGKNIKAGLWGKNANRLYHDGKYEEVQRACESRLAEKPKDALALWWLARTHQARNEPELAQRYFRQVIEVAPAWKTPYVDPFFDESNR